MDICKRVIAPCGEYLPEQDDIKLDVDALLRRLILFDTFILHSTRLKEIPHLVKKFGFEGAIALLDSQAIKIFCDATQLTQIGQSNLRERSKGILPLNEFAFSIIRPSNWESYISDCLKDLHQIPGLSLKQVIRLKTVVVDAMVTPSPSAGVETKGQLLLDIEQNNPTIKRLVFRLLNKKYGLCLANSDLKIHFQQTKEDEFRVETNLSTTFSLPEDKCHKIIEASLLAMGTVNQRIEEMKTHNALSGFKDEDTPEFGTKLDFFYGQLSPVKQEQRMRRVITLKDIPTINADEDNIVVDRLLKVRESNECKAFRDWLPKLDDSTNEEIKKELESIQAKVGIKAHTTGGKVVRFLVSTGLGIIPGAGFVLGTVAGGLDTFLLEKVLPYKGPIAFVNELYLSIFKDKGDS